jgi:hypothetical protein
MFTNDIIMGDGPGITSNTLYQNPMIFADMTLQNEDFNDYYQKYLYFVQDPEGTLIPRIDKDSPLSEAAQMNIALFEYMTNQKPKTAAELATDLANGSVDMMLNVDDSKKALELMEMAKYEQDPTTRYALMTVAGGALVIYQIDAAGNIIPFYGQAKTAAKNIGEATIARLVKIFFRETGETVFERGAKELLPSAAEWGAKSVNEIAGGVATSTAKGSVNVAESVIKNTAEGAVKNVGEAAGTRYTKGELAEMGEKEIRELYTKELANNADPKYLGDIFEQAVAR